MNVFTRKYIQFNDLVIDNYDMLKEAELSRSFKTESMSYSFAHGSYVAFKSEQQLSEEMSLSMTLNLDTRKLSCDQKRFYKDFVFINLVKPGKLWAIEGDQLLWTNAYIQNIGEAYSLEKHTLSLDVDFVLYEGIWHKADTRKVFLKPYSTCDFAECLDFRDVDECIDCCVACNQPKQTVCPKCICECEFLSSEYSLCELRKEVAEDFYKQCNDTYQIIYNCEAGRKIWGEDKMLGEKICKKSLSDGIIAGKFYSNTIMNSESVTITIDGKVNNPTININGNVMQIIGEYDGLLTLTESGDVYYQEKCCPAVTIVDVDNLKILDCSTFGFTVHQGENGIIVDTHDCCGMVCVYVKVDSITI